MKKLSHTLTPAPRPSNTCPQVRQLDRAQVRVADTLARLTAISDRMACLEGVSKALAAEDYEAGAGRVLPLLPPPLPPLLPPPALPIAPPSHGPIIAFLPRRFVAQFMQLEDKYSSALAAEEVGQAADQRDQLLARGENTTNRPPPTGRRRSVL